MAQSLVRELNIVILRVSDLEAARAFYADTLGLAVENETPGFLIVQPVDGQGASFGIGVGEPSATGISGATGAEIWWRVDDADALHAALVAKGVRITGEPADRPFGRALSFADPAGNVLHAFQPPR
jgi:catechol 2,3-dioxygenase-like lactoylglutathione lyase family enzyme